MGPPRRFDLRHPEILDPDLFAQQGRCLFKPIALGPEPYPLVAAVGRPTATRDQSMLSHGDHVQEGRFDLSRPDLGQRNPRNRLRPQHDQFPGNAVLRLPEKLA
jgi:hypothetical protein